MPQQILTDVVEIKKNTQDIEEELHKIFNAEIIRWAIVEVKQDKIKVCCSYKQG